MPLTPGYSRRTIAKNIRRELAEERPTKQAIAIALSSARRSVAARYCPKCKREASGAESLRCKMCFGKLRGI